MPKMINGTLNLTGYDHKVEMESKTTTITGLIVGKDGTQINVEVKLVIGAFAEDISPVLPLDKVEPVTFVLLPQSVQDEMAAEAQEAVSAMPEADIPPAGEWNDFPPLADEPIEVDAHE